MIAALKSELNSVLTAPSYNEVTYVEKKQVLQEVSEELKPAPTVEEAVALLRTVVETVASGVHCLLCDNTLSMAYRHDGHADNCIIVSIKACLK